ncbi:Transcription factor GAMYB [Dichanthelium oligosanthes]|uniref:Transcription factor GAMYB n=2 Tax=Panicoideae TaxID=147369 RepID=A0A1E5VNK8_9POAL|nr:Transcription factor GAMYB [Dichanthelium oligosanthes]
MARAPGGGRRRGGGGGRRDAAGSGEAVRKGPWMAEEDAVLLEHVRAHGPCDWSSIRSKGLLPRTGKSCRLRWVNKLRPDLKTGCKFSAEEERVVLELQAQFGNKWARIATYLPGRTDNDVKNFWSTRQKRLARLLRAPLPARSGRNSSAKAPAASSLESRPAATVGNDHNEEFAVLCPQREIASFFIYMNVNALMEMFAVDCHQGPCCPDQVPFGSSSSGVHPCCAATPFMDAQNAALVPYDQASSGLASFNGALPPFAPATYSHACSSSSNAAQLLPKLPFGEPSYPLLDYPGMPEGWNMAPGFINAGAMDDLAYQELLPMMAQPAPMVFPFFGTEHAQGGVKAEPPDAPDFFDDLPPDMFDSLDQVPPPLSPPATSSGF